MSSPNVAGIFDTTNDLDRLRKEQEQVLSEINKMHEHLKSTPEVVQQSNDGLLHRLENLYAYAKQLSEIEERVSTKLLAQLDALVPPEPPVQQQKWTAGKGQRTKRTKTFVDTAKMTISMQNHLDTLANLKGEQVAARLTQEGADKDQWVIVKVTHFNRETREFEVLDEEPNEGEEDEAQREYTLPVSHIIPFPKRNDLSNAQDFPPGRHVLALYPGTTALYKATVVHPRKRKTDDYVLEFDDDEEDGILPQRSVPFDRVVALPRGHRQ